jgi:hypothetical protein
MLNPFFFIRLYFTAILPLLDMKWGVFSDQHELFDVIVLLMGEVG